MSVQQHASLKDKVVLVTGGAGGIGRTTAMAFARTGARVVVADLAPSGAATAEAIVAEGGTATFVQTDVTNAAAVEALVAQAVRIYGGLDCAFNNAGIEEETAPTAECDEALWDRTINVNLKGVWLCMKYEIAQMLKGGGGAIVNTSSVAGLGAAPNMPAYAASKHAVIGITRTAAAEYGRAGIRVNAVCPGIIHTSMLERAQAASPDRIKAIQKMYPVRRFGTTDEVASAVLWLCSPEASFVTGHALAVDGGYLAI